jgi:hypothetical protein
MTDAELDVLVDDALPRPRPWKRSARGNLWRRFGAARLVVFRRGRGFAWLSDGAGGTWFSPGGYASEAEAAAAAEREAEL